jgi:BirA family biotin operon repressor/biotin-[acetyl-CoA-carboxylase] ligase
VAEVATSLRLAMGEEFDRGVIFRALLTRLDRWYAEFVANGPPSLIARWNEMCGTLGHHVTVRTGGETVRGKVVKLGLDGALVVRTRDGERRLYAGEVVEVVRQGLGPGV